MTAEQARVGRRIDSARIRFVFDGHEYCAQRGDSAASALLACGMRLFGRSMKYRRPRGLLSAGPEEPNALLTVSTASGIIPNVPAPQLIVTGGLVLRSQNRWPTLRYDIAAALQLGGGLLGAGFYYKTFIWPSWRTYEAVIRRLAGLGSAPKSAELDPPAVEYLSCDVLVGGAGAAGLAAALAAARAGAHVVICERERDCGGELEFEGGTIDGAPALHWVDTVLGELQSFGARILTDTSIVGGSDGLVIAHAEPGGLPGRNRIYRIRPRGFIIAMGAVERPIAFVDNDRPGVMLLGAAERYRARYGVAVGRRLVLFGNHDRLYAAATRFCAAGIVVKAIVDSRIEGSAPLSTGTEDLRAALTRSGVECLRGCAVVAAEGRLTVHGARVVPLGSGGAERRIDCDAILVSGGWSPAVHAGLHEGGRQSRVDSAAAFIADGQPLWRLNAGATNGALDLAAVVNDGFAAGLQAARAVAATGGAGPPPPAQGDHPPHLIPFWRSPALLKHEKRQFVDPQNDVTVSDIRQALAEGFSDIEHVKRYTTLGFGTDQGRIGGVVGAAILAELIGVPQAEVGISRPRPPYHPITLAAIAGHRVGPQIRALRRTPLHEWHVSHDGVLEPAGLWMRTRYYRRNGGEPFAAGVAEARRVRAHGGIVDGSTLGKIEVAGRDSAQFLDRMYLTKASTIKVGRCKYMVNLREDGMVLDDGIVLRVAEDRFVATTSSGHADHLLSHFELHRDTEWSGASVCMADVTEAWAVIAVAGPRSRDGLIAVLGEPWRPAIEKLTHMDFTAGRWRESELRVLRASFSGELAFEVHCRPLLATAIWQGLVDAGLDPYGLEALDILRVEKGYLANSELTGQATPMDLGMDAMVKLMNPCVGRKMLDRPAFYESTRPRLVGLRVVDGAAKVLGGAQITTADAPTISLGYVTSSAYSPALEEWIALAFLARSSAASGAELVARDPLRGGDVRVRVTEHVHLDPAGVRMKS